MNGRKQVTPPAAILAMAPAATRHGRAFVRGELPAWYLARVAVPGAGACFFLGALLALAALPSGFDYGACVISRLCSRVHNPTGHLFLTFGMILMALLLVPVPPWMARAFAGCERLSSSGQRLMWVGLAATIGVGVERAWLPTHWSRFESIHLALAGTAFLSLWLGLAMLAGADVPSGQPRVRWRWLYRPPWYLAACVMPLIVIFLMYLPVNLIPGARSAVLTSWPRRLVFLRTATFWQWYLVAGLFVSMTASTSRACQRLAPVLSLGPNWRFDPAQAGAPHVRPAGEGENPGRRFPPDRDTLAA